MSRTHRRQETCRPPVLKTGTITGPHALPFAFYKVSVPFPYRSDNFAIAASKVRVPADMLANHHERNKLRNILEGCALVKGLDETRIG